MKNYKFVVDVPATQANAYNPDRPISDLVRNQVMHLSLAERQLQKRHRSGTDIYSIQTERQASEYIEHLTKKLHVQKMNKPQRKPKAAPGNRKRK